MEEKLMRRMIHAIGLDNSKQHKYVYEAYRNSSYYNKPVEDWELLVAGGYAERIDLSESEIAYHCTKKGLKAIADETGLIIRYTIEVEPTKHGTPTNKSVL